MPWTTAPHPITWFQEWEKWMQTSHWKIGFLSFTHLWIQVKETPDGAVPVSMPPKLAKLLQFSQKTGKKAKSVPTKQHGSDTGQHQARQEPHRDLLSPQGHRKKIPWTVTGKAWNSINQSENINPSIWIHFPAQSCRCQLLPRMKAPSHLFHQALLSSYSPFKAFLCYINFRYWIVFLLLINTGLSYNNVKSDLWHTELSAPFP